MPLASWGSLVSHFNTALPDKLGTRSLGLHSHTHCFSQRFIAYVPKGWVSRGLCPGLPKVRNSHGAQLDGRVGRKMPFCSLFWIPLLSLSTQSDRILGSKFHIFPSHEQTHLLRHFSRRHLPPHTHKQHIRIQTKLTIPYYQQQQHKQQSSIP